MSGAGKKIVDVAFKAGKTIDWEGMAKLLVSDEARKEFATLRRAFDEVNTQLQTKFSQVPNSLSSLYVCIELILCICMNLSFGIFFIQLCMVQI